MLVIIVLQSFILFINYYLSDAANNKIHIPCVRLGAQYAMEIGESAWKWKNSRKTLLASNQTLISSVDSVALSTPKVSNTSIFQRIYDAHRHIFEAMNWTFFVERMEYAMWCVQCSCVLYRKSISTCQHIEYMLGLRQLISLLIMNTKTKYNQDKEVIFLILRREFLLIRIILLHYIRFNFIRSMHICII